MTDNSAGKKKNIRIAIAACVCVLAVGMLLRGFLFPRASSRDKLGLSALSITDENGDKWVLDLAKGQSLSTVKSSGREPGPPLMIKTDVQRSRQHVSIGLVVEGQAGEKYAGGATKNRRWMPPPRFTIVDEAGRTLASGVFKYG